ncbi:hypothetical protein KCU65_g5576, partial [Aureobasidium melanogenum]
MATAFGIVSGSVGIATAFSACVECFGYIQVGRHFGKDLQTALLTLGMLRLRLSRWGEAVNIYDDPKLGNPGATQKDLQLANDTVFQILVLLDNSSQVAKTFRLTGSQRVDLSVYSAEEAGHRVASFDITDNLFSWKVDDGGNNSLPFWLRAVNATGTDEEQKKGGFMTGQLWIKLVSLNTLAKSSTISMSSAESATAGSGTSSSPTSGASTRMASPTEAQNSSSDVSTSAIAGIVIGAVAVLAVIIGVFLFFKRQRKTTISSYLDLMNEHASIHDKSKYTPQDPSWDLSQKEPAELHGNQKEPAELHGNERVELPNDHLSRHYELE